MSKDSTLSLRVDSELKNEVEIILKQLGIPMSTAITMYFNQIKMSNGLPFTPKVINRPRVLSEYTEEELYDTFKSAVEEVRNGEGYTVEEVEEMMRKRYSLWFYR